MFLGVFPSSALLEKAVLDARAKPKLVSMIRRVHAQRKPLRVTLLGGGPCLEAAVIRQLVDKLKLVPKLKVQFTNHEKVKDWQGGHSALPVPVSTINGDLAALAHHSAFWKKLGQQHIVIAW